MAIYVISDLHGAPEALADEIPEDATLLLLGDLLNVIDYFEMSGILVEIFSAEDVGRVVDLRKAGRVEEARRVMRERSEGREQEIRTRFGALAAAQYQEIFAALRGTTYMILGNVDVPALAEGFCSSNPHVRHVHGEAAEIEGERFGFVGGALPTPLRTAGEISPEEMAAKLDELGPVDVLCTHIPPQIPDLCYDTLARRHEQGSDAILTYIQDVKPRVHYFGHVHQPAVSAMHVGETLCINVGHFRATKRAWLHEPPAADRRSG